MVLLVLLLFCSCAGCLREGVWTKYTPADVARWHAHAVDATTAPRRLFPAPGLVVSRPHPESIGFAEGAVLRREFTATPFQPAVDEYRARVA